MPAWFGRQDVKNSADRITKSIVLNYFYFVKAKQDNRSLYFVAIVPPEPIRSELTGLKNWMFEEFGSKAALRSPPHITLHMPFKWKHHKEKLLETSLKNLASTISTFEVQLHNFNCFEPRVIYVDVEKNEQLASLRNEVMRLSRQEWKLDLPKDLRGFNPHITIGFRDFKKPQFYKAWEQVKNKPFSAAFSINSLVLLKHNGTHWEEHKKFELA